MSVPFKLLPDGQKELQSRVSLVNDLSAVSGTIVSVLQKEKFENLAQNFINSMRKGIGKETIKINLANSEFLSALGKGFAKVSAYAVIIISILDAIKYKKNEDYDALAATVGMFSVAVAALFIASGTPLVIFVAIASIAYALVMIRFIDSAFEVYLKRSLFYKNDDIFPAKYLLESTNKNPTLKALNSKGFKSPKEIFNFIGKNYKTNEIYFDTALENELSFLISAMYGITLQKVDYRITNRRTVIAGIERGFNVEHAVGIPKSLVDDKKFQFFFAPYEGGSYLEFSRNHLIEGSEYDIFNLFPDEAPRYQSMVFAEHNRRSPYKAHIIILSSLINAKYEIKLDRGVSENYIMKISQIEQISFTPQDKQFIEGKIK